MKLGFRLTAADLVRTLSMQAHRLADHHELNAGLQQKPARKTISDGTPRKKGRPDHDQRSS